MRDELPPVPMRKECGIINLDDHIGPGTHWVAYYKSNNTVVYFDSFGNLQPPSEFIKYMGSAPTIFYNYEKYQDFGTINCGHLCIQFLSDSSNKELRSDFRRSVLRQTWNR